MYVSPLISIQIQYHAMTCSIWLSWNFWYMMVSDDKCEANYKTLRQILKLQMLVYQIIFGQFMIMK